MIPVEYKVSTLKENNVEVEAIIFSVRSVSACVLIETADYYYYNTFYYDAQGCFLLGGKNPAYFSTKYNGKKIKKTLNTSFFPAS